MSMFLLATGTLIADPASRVSAKGNPFVTAIIKVGGGDDSCLLSVVAFGELAEALLEHKKAGAIAVSGRAKLTSWTGKDGEEKHGLSLVVDQLASASGARRAGRKEAGA